jgi:hypothetical protein
MRSENDTFPAQMVYIIPTTQNIVWYAAPPLLLVLIMLYVEREPMPLLPC